MAKFVHPGPIVTFGQRPTAGAAASAVQNPQLGPSSLFGGMTLNDGRMPYDRRRLGWIGLGSAFMVAIGVVAPATAATTAVAAAAATVAGTPMTLVSTSGAGIVISTTANTVWPSGVSVPATACWVDSVPALVGFGLADVSTGNYQNNIYDPTKMLARAVSVTGNAGSSANNITVVGYDVYGYAMSEVIAHPGGAATTNGKKAFKAIISATPDTTDAGHTIAVGLTDVIGLPVRMSSFAKVLMWYGGTTTNPGPLITTVPTNVAGDATDPATTTTGDVRGTITLPSASDGTKALSIAQAIRPANMGTNAGHWGVFQNLQTSY